MTQAAVRVALPGKFSRAHLRSMSPSGYAWREGAWRWQDMVFGAYSMGGCNSGCTALGSAMLCCFAALLLCCFAALLLCCFAACCSRRLRNVCPTSFRYPALHRSKPAAAHHDGCSLTEGGSRLCRLTLLSSAWQHRAVATRPGISMHGEDACFPSAGA